MGDARATLVASECFTSLSAAAPPRQRSPARRDRDKRDAARRKTRRARAARPFLEIDNARLVELAQRARRFDPLRFESVASSCNELGFVFTISRKAQISPRRAASPSLRARSSRRARAPPSRRYQTNASAYHPPCRVGDDALRPLHEVADGAGPIGHWVVPFHPLRASPRAKNLRAVAPLS